MKHYNLCGSRRKIHNKREHYELVSVCADLVMSVIIHFDLPHIPNYPALKKSCVSVHYGHKIGLERLHAAQLITPNLQMTVRVPKPFGLIIVQIIVREKGQSSEPAVRGAGGEAAGVCVP